MKVSIIIPNYNGEELLKKNLPKVFDAAKANKNGEVEIIVVDDGSTDNSVDEIHNYNAEFKVIQNEKNLGFSSAINRGVKEANGQMIVLLNTDVVVQANFLEPLIKHFRDPDVFAVGCMDKNIENGKVVLRGRGIGKWHRGFLMHQRGEVNKKDTLWVNGGSGAFKRRIWEKIGGFDQLYNPFYWEDIDLSYRALKSGYKILFENKSVVQHEHLQGAIKKNFSSFQVKSVAYRNQFIFVWKNATDLNLWFSHILWLPYHLIKSLMRADLAFLIGFFQAFVMLPKIIQSRFKIQKLFIKRDKDITPLI